MFSWHDPKIRPPVACVNEVSCSPSAQSSRFRGSRFGIDGVVIGCTIASLSMRRSAARNLGSTARVDRSTPEEDQGVHRPPGIPLASPMGPFRAEPAPPPKPYVTPRPFESTHPGAALV